MTDGHGDLKLPLPLFNPMGKEHVAAVLDLLIAGGAEATARSALARVAERLSEDAHGPQRIAAATAEAVYRHAYQRRHGEPRLRDRLLQEGLAARFGGAPEARLDPAERARTDAIVRRHLDSDRFATCFACLYGDDAAGRAGYDPLGLAPWAGLAFAAETVAAAGCDPVEALATGPRTALPALR